MNKKKIAILLGSILAVFVVSATLVSYLSNTATMNVDVTSPMSIEFAEVAHGGTPQSAIDNVADGAVTWTSELTTGSTTGLSTLELGVKLVNNANVNIEDRTLAITLTSDLHNVGCDDVTSLTFIDVGASSETTYFEVVQQLAGIGLCIDDGVSATYNIPINSLGSGQTYKYPVTMTFGNVAPATYTASGVVLD